MKFEVRLDSVYGARTHTVELEPASGGFRFAVDGQLLDADARTIAPGTVSVLIGGHAFEVHVTPALGNQIKLQCGPHEFAAEVQDPRSWKRRQGSLEAEGRQQIVAPMPGKVIRVLVNPGDQVEAGQGLVVVEAMKMQNEIRSPKKGKVERLHIKEGQNVNAGDILAWVD